MIASLLRRDQAMRTLSTRAMAVTLLSATFLINVMILQVTRARADAGVTKGVLYVLPSEPGTGVFAVHLAIAWTILIVFLLLARVQQRVGPFDLALPIPARTIWRGRFLGQVLAGTILLALVGILVALANWGLTASPIHARFLEWPAAVTHIAHLIAGLCLASALTGSFHLELTRLPADRRLLAALAGAFLGTLAIMLVLSPYGPATALITLALAAFVVHRTESQLPASFVMAPRDTTTAGGAAIMPVPGPEPLEPGATAAGRAPAAHLWRDAPPSAWSSSLLLARTIWRALYGHVLGFMLLGIVALYSFFLAGGALTIGDESADTGPVWIPIIWYLLLAFMSKFMKKLYLLDGLPISRRTLFAALTLPGLIALMLGYGVGKAVLMKRIPTPPAIVMNAEEGYPDLRVSLEHFRVDWNGTPPPLTSPWGETHEAKTIPILTAGGPALYKPYTTPEGSSADFVALQLSRALCDIYGRALSVEQVRERYVKNGTEPVSLRAGGVPLTEDLERWTPRVRGQVFPVIMVLVVVPWLLMTAALMRIFRAGISATQQKVLVLAVMGTAMLVQGGLILTAVVDRLDLWTYSCAIKSIGHQLALSLPGGMVIEWALAAILVLTAYRFAEWRFARVEAMIEKKGCWPWT